MGDKSPKSKDKAKSQHAADQTAKKNAAKAKSAPPAAATAGKKGK